MTHPSLPAFNKALSFMSLQNLRTPLAIAIGIATLNMATLSAAQESTKSAEPNLKLEEVFVTAQKREESLQDVPISVSTVNGDKLAEAGIENIEDLTAHMPSIHFTQTGISTQVRVRGIGSDNSQGFEQSVGTYVDGIYYGRAQLFRAPLMDMERAELLRGPQGTLFGKNSVAGALNLTTAKPTEEREGRLSLAYEPEYNQQEINAMLSGSLSETLRGRIALRSYQEDGYVYNNFRNEDQPNVDEKAIRISLAWDASDQLNFLLKAERDTFDVRGRAIEITQDVSFAGGPAYSPLLQGLAGAPGFDSDADYVRDADADEFSDNTVTNVTLTTNYQWDDLTITAITGALGFDYKELCDCDFTAAEIINLNLEEDYDQFSQEIRIASPQGEKIEWLAGAFYQNYDQTFNDSLGVASGSLLPSLVSPLLADTATVRNFEQSSDTWALFARGTWNINEKWHVTLGARYTEEDKDATKQVNIIDTLTGDYASTAAALVYLSDLFRVESEQAQGAGLIYSGHNVQGSRKESAFTPLINVEYEVNDDVMAYTTLTQGFKSGGFDPRSNSVGNTTVAGDPNTADAEANPLRSFEFEEEKSNNAEIGLKTTLADGRGELNVALYYTDYRDLQISQFDGGVGFNVGNVKKTEIKGIEVDGRWRISETLTSSYGLSLLDFEYKDFKNGNCYAGQTPNGIDITGDDVVDTCDYSGKRGVYTPEYTLNVSLDYFTAINNDINFIGFIDLQHVAGHQVHVNLDPSGEIDAYTMVGARIGIEGQNWSAALVGKNLLDEEVISYSANAPLSSGASFNTNTHYSFIRRPRTITLEATLKF